MMPPSSFSLCLAIETDGAAAAQLALPLDRAEAFGELVAADLRNLHPGIADTDLASAVVHYDPVEILQPKWALFRELELMAARAPGQRGQSRIVCFGADAEGNLPSRLRPQAQFSQGPLRTVPIALQGERTAIGDITQRLEERLLETGMASARTALWVQENFGLAAEHVRYMTAWDLAAMMHLQYRHAGVDFVWPLIEAALKGDGSDQRIVLEGEPEIIKSGGEIFIATGRSDDPVRARQLPLRQRQLAAILGAHGIPVALIDEGEAV